MSTAVHLTDENADSSPDRADTLSSDDAPIFPFTAILGQDELKNCLLLSAVEPRIAGVLATGDRGTAKTTTIRALGQLLERSELQMPVAELPLGATEDRVVGTLDPHKALRGELALSPGILSKAHQGFLYIDEVNLLDDSLVDLLLDVAASGVNRVERDGLSHRHPARFILVGSGNPEEGELRPQLEDRFGLATRIRTLSNSQQRMQLIHRRLAFDANPASFLDQWAAEETQLAARITQARRCLPQVDIPPEVLQRVVDLCVETGTVGHRADVVLARTARALAALAGRETVRHADVLFAAVPTLQHRISIDPANQGASASSRVRLTAARVLGIRAP